MCMSGWNLARMTMGEQDQIECGQIECRQTQECRWQASMNECKQQNQPTRGHQGLASMNKDWCKKIQERMKASKLSEYGWSTHTVTINKGWLIWTRMRAGEEYPVSPLTNPPVLDPGQVNHARCHPYHPWWHYHNPPCHQPLTTFLDITSHDHWNQSNDWFTVCARVEAEDRWGRGKGKNRGEEGGCRWGIDITTVCHTNATSTTPSITLWNASTCHLTFTLLLWGYRGGRWVHTHRYEWYRRFHVTPHHLQVGVCHGYSVYGCRCGVWIADLWYTHAEPY